MANRKRPIILRCPVTAEERALIEQKMAQLPTQRIGAYLRKMAIDGYIIYTDTTDIKAFTAELSAIGRNINQIAKKLNAGGSVYATIRGFVLKFEKLGLLRSVKYGNRTKYQIAK